MIILMQKPKFQYIIWGLCFLILLQAGWIGLRFNQLNQRKIEEVRIQEQMIQEQEEQAKEELKSIPEPQIEEKLASGGKLWLEPAEGNFSDEFELEIWAEIEKGKEIKKIDLRLFYHSDLLKIVGEEWYVHEGVIFWSKEREETLGGRFIVQTVKFEVLKSGKAEIELDFNKESLLDCNLLTSEGEDILEEAYGGSYNLSF